MNLTTPLASMTAHSEKNKLAIIVEESVEDSERLSPAHVCKQDAKHTQVTSSDSAHTVENVPAS